MANFLDKLLRLMFPTQSYKKAEVFEIFCVIPSLFWAALPMDEDKQRNGITYITAILGILIILNIILSLYLYKKRDATAILIVGYVSLIIACVSIYFIKGISDYVLCILAYLLFLFISSKETDEY